MLLAQIILNFTVFLSHVIGNLESNIGH